MHFLWYKLEMESYYVTKPSISLQICVQRTEHGGNRLLTFFAPNIND